MRKREERKTKVVIRGALTFALIARVRGSGFRCRALGMRAAAPPLCRLRRLRRLLGWGRGVRG